jgi:hypothetical protein
MRRREFLEAAVWAVVLFAVYLAIISTTSLIVHRIGDRPSALEREVGPPRCPSTSGWRTRTQWHRHPSACCSPA